MIILGLSADYVVLWVLGFILLIFGCLSAVAANPKKELGDKIENLKDQAKNTEKLLNKKLKKIENILN